jgi:hypothetical protein
MSKTIITPVLWLLLICNVAGHTWLFTRGRATVESSLDKPFRARKSEAGEDVHAQVGLGQEIVVRWASSHENTFMFAIVAGRDQDIFWDECTFNYASRSCEIEDFYSKVNDYIDSAPESANQAVEKPRYHGSPAGKSRYLKTGTTTFETCSGGHCVNNLFSRELPSSDPAYVAHSDDMPGNPTYTNSQYEYNPALIGTDRRVAYNSTKYPWLIGAYRYLNLVNMHTDWDMVKMEIPAWVNLEATGQHFIVHFSSHSPEDYTYTDAIDVHAHKSPVDESLIYGETTGDYGWTKIDHCQFVEPENVVSPIRNATNNAQVCGGTVPLCR